MRFVAVIAIWVILIGGLQLFLGHRQSLAPMKNHTQAHATGLYRLDITSTFTAKTDPFALNIEGDDSSSAVVIQLGGHDIFKTNETIEAGRAITITPLPDLKVGKNEFYIEISPPLDQAQQAQAVRIRLFQDDRLIQQKSFWSEPGERLVGTFTVAIAEQPAQENSGHDH